ncbi:MAG: flagellar biosynthesis protein FlhA [Bradymonadia bacterium]
MAAVESTGIRQQLSGMWFAGGVVGLLLLMVVELPTFLLDALLALNLTIALVVLVVAIYLKRPLDFSGFPAVLLLTTLFRLCLNVASTRLILLKGKDQGEAAGQIIQAFGEKVVGGNYVVGIIIFIVLIIINFMVITKGSGRIAEVGARFTLDAMPGKQMAIDADLNAGLITEDEAKQRRRDVEREADFYGAMDGASKFVRGDTIAGILITFINIIGGFIVGTAQLGMDAGDAAETFTMLTVGDGLVSQIPSLVISTAAGIIVTRAAGTADLGSELGKQLTGNDKVLKLVAGILLLMIFAGGMPFFTFGAIAAGLFWLATRMNKPTEEEAAGSTGGGEGAAALGGTTEEAPQVSDEERIAGMLPIDQLELHVGYGLIGIVDPAQGGDMVERIRRMREQFALEMGVILPPVHIRDDLQLAPDEYRLLIKGVSAAEGELMPSKMMMLVPDPAEAPQIEGVPTMEPAFGMAARWIDPQDQEEAEGMGYTVVEGTTVVATHIGEVLRKNAHELVGRTEAQRLVDILSERHPKLVEALIPNKVDLGDLVKVIKNLLIEQVSVRDLRTILEAMADFPNIKSPEVLAECVRQRLNKVLSATLRGPDGVVHVLQMDGAMEGHLRGALKQIDNDLHFVIDPAIHQAVVEQAAEGAGHMQACDWMPVLITAPELRRAMSNLLTPYIDGLRVISTREIAPGVEVNSEGIIGGGIPLPPMAEGMPQGLR